MDNEGSKKTAYNVAGTIIGALLAALAIFGVVQMENGKNQPQPNAQLISYNS